jgi:hypothetical protein
MQQNQVARNETMRLLEVVSTPQQLPPGYGRGKALTKLEFVMTKTWLPVSI